ncbi:MAG: hypothetical protein D6721_05935 [Gammaproteobacteria bacterium]|nr:MAG: hypothetical protein D6721_05935 [Gammaproteobacteria bacterium]
MRREVGGAGSWGLGARSWELEAGSWELEVRIQKSEGWKPEPDAESFNFQVLSAMGGTRNFFDLRKL